METGKIQLKSFIDKLKVTDTHEHFFEMTHPGRRGLDLFRLIGDAYVCGDIFCAGADFKLLFETPVSAGKKWQELRKILPAVKTTSYYRYLDDMFKNLYEVKQGLTDSTWQELNEKISAKGTDRAWVADVVTKRSGIENILLDRYWDPLLKNAEFNFIRPIFRINIYVMGTHGDIDGDGNRLFSVYPGLKQKVKDLDSYLAFIESCVANAKKNGYVGLKSALAYDRTLYYEDVPKGEASKIYKMKRSSMTSVQKKKLEDY